jgi:NAD-dependent deacetylase
MTKKKIVVLSGAGVSAESGISTFRDSGGLWERYDILEIASIDAWHNNPSLVLDFYNQRRKQLYEVAPNEAHILLHELEKEHDVMIVTQNVDDLHERAGNTRIMHLHGELKKVRSTIDPNLVYTLNGWELKMGDLCEKGSQLRPHIVWFGESVPGIQDAIPYFKQADICLVIGTSLNVYPAAGLIQYISADCQLILIDPKDLPPTGHKKTIHFREKASIGMQRLFQHLGLKA